MTPSSSLPSEFSTYLRKSELRVTDAEHSYQPEKPQLRKSTLRGTNVCFVLCQSPCCISRDPPLLIAALLSPSTRCALAPPMLQRRSCAMARPVLYYRCARPYFRYYTTGVLDSMSSSELRLC
eukprot:1677045-Rhodomonas_salina.1